MGDRYEIIAAHMLEEHDAKVVVVDEAARLGFAFTLRPGRGYAPEWHEAGLERTVEVVAYARCRHGAERLAARLRAAFSQDAVLLAARPRGGERPQRGLGLSGRGPVRARRALGGPHPDVAPAAKPRPSGRTTEKASTSRNAGTPISGSHVMTKLRATDEMVRHALGAELLQDLGGLTRLAPTAGDLIPDSSSQKRGGRIAGLPRCQSRRSASTWWAGRSL